MADNFTQITKNIKEELDKVQSHMQAKQGEPAEGQSDSVQMEEEYDNVSSDEFREGAGENGDDYDGDNIMEGTEEGDKHGQGEQEFLEDDEEEKVDEEEINIEENKLPEIDFEKIEKSIESLSSLLEELPKLVSSIKFS